MSYKEHKGHSVQVVSEAIVDSQGKIDDDGNVEVEQVEYVDTVKTIGLWCETCQLGLEVK